jgi:hypothetical protein
MFEVCGSCKVVSRRFWVASVSSAVCLRRLGILRAHMNTDVNHIHNFMGLCLLSMMIGTT